MKFNPEIHHRHTIRLQGYDYSSPGGYFITICTQGHECLFGQIQIPVGADLRVCPNICVCPKKHVCPDKHVCPHYNGMGYKSGEHNETGEHIGSPLPVMILNDAGRMVEKWYNELPNKFPDIKIDKFICMPDHVHFILFNVGADLRVCPNMHVCPNKRPNNHKTGGHIGPPLRGENNMGEHIGSPLHAIVRWFKTMTTNEYVKGIKQSGWQPFNGKLWQRNYYEHIIRNENELFQIREYVENNPANWETDPPGQPHLQNLLEETCK